MSCCCFRKQSQFWMEGDTFRLRMKESEKSGDGQTENGVVVQKHCNFKHVLSGVDGIKLEDMGDDDVKNNNTATAMEVTEKLQNKDGVSEGIGLTWDSHDHTISAVRL